MNKILLTGILMFIVNTMFAQIFDFTSVDEFFKVTSILRQGKEVSKEQWKDFENSGGYKSIAEKNKLTINTIKHSIELVFGYQNKVEIDSILNLPKDKMQRLILINYQNIDKNYLSLKAFRSNYDFNALIIKSKQRLGSFLDTSIDSTIKLKPISLFFLSKDGQDAQDVIYLDFNLIYEMTEEQRIDFLAHEYFHNYREYFENKDYYTSDLNYVLDMIQNEGIADQIDKSEGYEKYFSLNPDLSELFVGSYNKADNDLKKLHDIIIKYKRNEISKDEMVDKLLEVFKFNGHAIGFYMSNQIIKAGYRKEMIKTFYNPYEFYKLYNLAATKNNIYQLSDEFMEYLKNITKEYYR